MHGRISYFNYKTGIGMIVDKHKRAFDLRSSMWHDPTTIPSIGMNVEFFLNEKNLVADCKASNYQDFSEEPFLKEDDFWDTESDLALSELEEKRKEGIINARAKEVDLKHLLILEPNKSPADAFKGFFYAHNKIIERNADLIDLPQSKQLNYFLVKRFLEKTMTQLSYLDKRINPEEFATLRQEMIEIEYLFTAFMKMEKGGKTPALESIFLRHQIDYLAVKKAVSLQQESIMLLESNQRMLESEIRHLTAKMGSHPEGSADRAPYEAKIAEKKAQFDKLATQIATETTLIEQANEGLKNFSSRYLSELPGLYAQTRQTIKTSLRRIIDGLADRLDSLLWQKAMASEAVMNSFYKQEINDPFCTMTFMRYYLERLDREKAGDADKALFDYLSEYDRSRTKKFVLISENPAVLRRIKLFILSGSKDHRVFAITKAVEYLGQCQHIQPHAVVIDEGIKSITPVELITESRKRTLNPSTHYILFAN